MVLRIIAAKMFLSWWTSKQQIHTAIYSGILSAFQVVSLEELPLHPAWLINLSCQIHPSRHFCERRHDEDGLTVTSGNFKCSGNLQSPEHVQECPLCVIFSKSLAFLPWHFCPNAPIHLHSSIFPAFCRGWQSWPAFPCMPPQQKLKKPNQLLSG